MICIFFLVNGNAADFFAIIHIRITGADRHIVDTSVDLSGDDIAIGIILQKICTGNRKDQIAVFLDLCHGIGI